MKKYLFLTVALITSLIFASCQEEEFGYNSFEIAYKTNFEKVYGKIKPDQTWDLTTYNLNKLGLVGGPSAMIQTRATSADEPPYPIDQIRVYANHDQLPGFGTNATTGNTNPEYLDNKFSNWFNKNNVTPKVIKSFIFEKPTAPFTIVPISKTTSTNWELHLVDMGPDGDKEYDYKITDYTRQNDPVVIKPNGITGNFYFYIKVGENKDNTMALFDEPAQGDSHVEDNTPNIVLGCETGKTQTKDYKDLALLIIVPQTAIKDIEDDPDDPVVRELFEIEDIKKKYLIEDKGSSVDFDFNDIVVLVEYYNKVNIYNPSDVRNEQWTKAKLLSLCGTIPFSLSIGTSEFGPFDGQVGETDANGNVHPYVGTSGYGGLWEGVEIQGFDITGNNIEVEVEGGRTGVQRITFPELGGCPYIIAVDANVEPKEIDGENISQTWFETHVKQP